MRLPFECEPCERELRRDAEDVDETSEPDVREADEREAELCAPAEAADECLPCDEARCERDAPS